MENEDFLLNPFQTFFTLSRTPCESLDTDTIWNDIVAQVPQLRDDQDVTLKLKKEIIAFFTNKEYVQHYIEKYDCTKRELLLVFIKKHFEAFDKYLIKKLICII